MFIKSLLLHSVLPSYVLSARRNYILYWAYSRGELHTNIHKIMRNAYKQNLPLSKNTVTFADSSFRHTVLFVSIFYRRKIFPTFLKRSLALISFHHNNYVLINYFFRGRCKFSYNLLCRVEFFDACSRDFFLLTICSTYYCNR